MFLSICPALAACSPITSSSSHFKVGIDEAFTVLSRKKGSTFFSGLTWDVKHLKDSGNWEILINSDEEIAEILEKYNNISNDHQNSSADFIPNTIVVWKGLYKFENFLDVKNKQDALKEEITNTTSEYLSIVFHKFMERQNNFEFLRPLFSYLVIILHSFPLTGE